MKGLNKQLKKLKLVASDCDGVLTDGGLYYFEDGSEAKRFHVMDGMGFLLLEQQGIITAIITAESTKLVEHRARKLKIDELIMSTKDKLGALEMLCRKHGITMSEVCYIGDDVFDVPAIKASGWGCVPSSANEYIQTSADYVTKKGGGQGCFREIADMILAARESE